MEYIKITKVDDVLLFRRGVSHKGTLHLTTHHLIFTLPPSASGMRELWCCYPMIEKVELNRGSSQLYLLDAETHPSLCRGASLRVRCRDFTYLAFDFADLSQCQDVFESIMKLTCIDDIDKVYAFIYTPIKIEVAFDGWNDYDVRSEFQRQGLDMDAGPWRLSSLNSDYRLCRSYPSHTVVPRSISDTILAHSVSFRSKNRFPALTYYYAKNGACIVRSAQPLTGIKQNRSLQDEKLLTEIFATNGRQSTANLIVDARPMTNAMAQAALGAGTEVMENYSNCKKVFLNIENIHVMRESLNKIKEVLKNSDVSTQLYNPELLIKSGWLDHISNLLKATDLLVKSVHLNGMHLMLHCSDGWDRTSQVASLVQLCLDPYFRTMDGFVVLVEKDWCSFGHRFNERCGHLQRETKFYNYAQDTNFQKIKQLNQHFKHHQNTKLESPVFQQFLDCVYQLMRQHPEKFEFNERFLRRLVYHLYSCQYGTFLYDSEREKKELRLESRTQSVWNYFKSRKREFSNPGYHEQHDIIYPNYNNVRFWYQLFGKSDEEMNGFLNVGRPQTEKEVPAAQEVEGLEKMEVGES
ncbi:hypothetical protein KL921_001600 [Ogataea angusta]|nr:hypothetical protein KL921_001600 [Ogataea angusta]KAG7834467.1 hypothetical protein KL943_002851 [Ogataea angusta]KAG7859966.1 hypothetical protein KL919_002671 [Ogataea angusta]KAG7861812.1 hypothetical protein KL939_000833 [Ogataea angusta]